MLIDARTRFADGTALSTAAPATAKYGEDLDASVVADQGDGIPLYLVAQVATTVTSGGSATLTLQLVTADNAALTTNVEVVFQSPQFALANLSAGARLVTVALPKRLYRRYIGLRQVIGTAALTAGALDAFLTQEPDNWRAYAADNGYV